MEKLGFRLGIATLLLVSHVECCSVISEFVFLTYEQSLYKSDLVLYGRDLIHTTNNDTKWGKRQDSTFQVFCVLKNTNGYMIRDTIKIHGIEPINSCETSPPEVGNDYVVLLKERIEKDTFEWAAPKVVHSAKFDVSGNHYLKRARFICGFQNMSVPEGRSINSRPACPSTLNPSLCIVPSTAVRDFICEPLIMPLLTLSSLLLNYGNL